VEEFPGQLQFLLMCEVPSSLPLENTECANRMAMSVNPDSQNVIS
jgi:hypothetical protein